jgi:hypothetical protein
MVLAPAAGLCIVLLAVIALVARPVWRARPGSLLGRARRRAVTTAVVIALVVVAALALADADAARDRAMSAPVGPGWNPELGLAEVARAAAFGLLATLVGGPYVAVALMIDLLGARNLRRASSAPAGTDGIVDVGLGDQVLERAHPHDYRSDASPDVAVRGDVASGRKILVRAALVHAFALVLLVALFAVFALVTLAAAIGA